MEGLLRELLKQTDPSALAWIAGAGIILKFLMDVVKRFAPNLEGNAVQTVTGAMSLLASIIQAGIANVYVGGLSAKEVGSILIIGALNYSAAVGVHETLKNRNPPKVEPDLKEQLKADAEVVTDAP